MRVSRCNNLTPDVTKFVLLELSDISVLSVPFAYNLRHQKRHPDTRVCRSTHGKFHFEKHKMLEQILKFDSLQNCFIRTATEPWI